MWVQWGAIIKVIHSFLVTVQYQCMDGALSGRNLMMFAKKGTGKSVVHAVSVLNEFTPVEGEVGILVQLGLFKC